MPEILAYGGVAAVIAHGRFTGMQEMKGIFRIEIAN
jgi:hypothetical protein